MAQAENQDATKMWVYGKKEPGWYVAKGIWDGKLASHWEQLGYRVQRSIVKPTNQGRQ